jgi:C4-dicarboxylate-binding protein DctP
MFHIRTMTCSAAVLSALIAFPIAANAQQTINLTAIDGYPPRASWVREFVEFYIPEVDKRLAASGKFKINWTQAWSGQIAKPGGVLSAMEQGLGDIAIITVPFYSDRLPMNVLPFNMPFTSSDPTLMSKVMDDLAAKFPEFRGQFEKANQVLLTNYSTIDTYQLFTSRAVTKPSDLKGVRINAAGDNMRYLEPTGAVGVRGALADYYNNIKTGVVEGAVMWAEGAVSFKLFEVAPYLVDVKFGTAVNKSLTVNKNTWDKLAGRGEEGPSGSGDRTARPPRQAGVRCRREVAQGLCRRRRQDRRNFRGRAPRMGQALPNLAQEWAAAAEKQGLPGKAYLKGMMDGLRAGGAKPLRDWDKE